MSEEFRRSFASVAQFLGRPHSDTVLFAATPLESNSITPEDVERLASQIGLEAAYIGDNKGGLAALDLPAIVFSSNLPPFAILERTDDGLYRTSGLANVPKALTEHEFRAIEGGKVVSFSLYQAANNDEDGSISSSYLPRKHWLWGTLKAFWPHYLRVMLAASFINVLGLVVPIFTMNVYDRILPNSAISTLWLLAAGVGLCVLFDLLLKTSRSSLIDHAGREADIRLSYSLFEKVLLTSLNSRPTSTGEYANRATQYEFVREFFTSNTLGTAIDSLFVGFFLLAIFWVGGAIVIIPICALLLTILIGFSAQLRIKTRVAKAMNEAGMRQSLLVESISTLETIKALRAEATLLKRWKELTRNASRTSQDIKSASAFASNATYFVQQLTSVGIVIAGVYAFSNGNLSMGAIIASVMLASRAVAPLSQLAVTLARFNQATLSIKILNQIMNQPEDRPSSVGFVHRKIRNGSITFRDVDFVYPGSEQKVLNGLNLSIRSGERVGIIGRIGSGKTTLGRLLARLFLPTSGDLLIDGIDVRQYHPAEVRASVGFATQTPDLFSGTIKENLLMARPDASDDEIIEAARASGVDEFVSRHPRGYDLNVGERGENLSGGQKQAVAVARILLSRPQIVFLDEPSGSMDLATERRLLSQLRMAFDESTTLVVATHRHSMLELVDRLVVLDQGRVVADGPKQTVLEALQRGESRGIAANKVTSIAVAQQSLALNRASDAV